jgi:hypothetical protein
MTDIPQYQVAKAGFEEYGLGRVPSEDSRDRSFPMALLLEEKPLATRRYYRTGPVLDQGSEPQCVGAAWSQFVASAPLMTRSGPHMTAIYQAAKKIDDWPGESYSGTSVRAGVKVLHALGHIESYFWAWGAATVAAFLLGNKGTVVAGTVWTTGMFTPDKHGVIKPEGPSAGGHAYLLVGYNQQEGRFRILNSWGTKWGDGGRAWIEGEDLDRLIMDYGGEACTAIERVIVPQSLAAEMDLQ